MTRQPLTGPIDICEALAVFEFDTVRAQEGYPAALRELCRLKRAARAIVNDDPADLDGLRVVATLPAFEPIDFAAARRDDQARAEREAAFTRRVERFRGQGGVS